MIGSHDFSIVGRWPRGRATGIAYGWEGHAWAWLHLVLAGVVADRLATREAIHARLRRIAREPTRTHASVLVGSASAPVVAALASVLDARFGELAREAIERWIAGTRIVTSDVMTGAAGAYLAAAEIAGYLPDAIPADFVAEIHQRCLAALRRLIEQRGTQPIPLGLAHGLAGYLLALESGQAVFSLALPEALRTVSLAVLTQERMIVETRQPTALWAQGSGARRPDFHGWCHGTPGIALALLAGHRLSRRRPYRRLAEEALSGISLYRPRNQQISMCCGVLGQIQILIEASRQTEDACWLDDARRLWARIASRRAAVLALADRTMWRGAPGLHYVRWRLKHAGRLPFPGLGPLSRAGVRGLAQPRSHARVMSRDAR